MEKYPNKRSWARPKLQRFLKEKDLYKEFVFNCKEQKIDRANKDLILSFDWSKSGEGYIFWERLSVEFDA